MEFRVDLDTKYICLFPFPFYHFDDDDAFGFRNENTFPVDVEQRSGERESINDAFQPFYHFTSTIDGPYNTRAHANTQHNRRTEMRKNSGVDLPRSYFFSFSLVVRWTDLHSILHI